VIVIVTVLKNLRREMRRAFLVVGFRTGVTLDLAGDQDGQEGADTVRILLKLATKSRRGTGALV